MNNKLPENYKEYKPLPEGLKIQDSNIHGQGLFSIKFIPKFTELGVSHYELYDLFIRTPLGGHINHSKHPNCNTVKDTGYKHILLTLKDIQPDEELTLDYSIASCANICSA